MNQQACHQKVSRQSRVKERLTEDFGFLRKTNVPNDKAKMAQRKGEIA